MADEEQVRILREEGIEAWNNFVREMSDSNLDWKVDLSGADLTGTAFAHANLLLCADLSGVNLSGEPLPYADLSETDLTGADLTGAFLIRADLFGANLAHSNLSGAVLIGANLTSANLTNANLSNCEVGPTTFANTDFTRSKGLASMTHAAPSEVGHQTLRKSRGKIPDGFLKGCGLQNWEILNAKLYDPDLTDYQRIDIAYEVVALSAQAPIQPNPIFVSYTHADSRFVDRLQAALDKRSIRSWRDVHDAEAGPLEKVIDRAISLNPTMVLVLSRASCGSSWVRYEIAKALELEQQLGRAVLCPVAIDDAWLTALPAQQREEVKRYHVLDLSAPDAIEKQMPRLLKGLQIHYRGETPGE